MALPTPAFPDVDWDGNEQDTTNDGAEDPTLEQAGDYNEIAANLQEVQRQLRGEVATPHAGLLFPVVNKTGGALTCGKIVAFDGFDATTGLPKVTLGAADAATCRDLAGLLVMEKGGDVDSVANDAVGYVLRSGAVYLVDTNSWVAGTLLWPAASGALASTRVAGYRPIARVDVQSATVGVLVLLGADAGAALPRATCAHRIGGLAASDDRFVFAAPAAGYIRRVLLVSDTATSGSDAGNNWTFQVANKTQTNNLCATAKTTNGAEAGADAVYNLGVDQNLQMALNDVLELQVTKTGSPTDLTSAEISVFVEYDLVQDA